MLFVFIGNDGQLDKRNAKRSYTISHKKPSKTSQEKSKFMRFQGALNCFAKNVCRVLKSASQSSTKPVYSDV